MQNEQSNSKRIAKNTLLLYFRMMLLTVVSLYTSRVILNALGVIDYGVYNVVGGVVTMFSVLSGSLTAAITRFLTFEMGTGNRQRLKAVFSTSVTIQILIMLIVLLFAETLGLWFVNEKLVIPPDRLAAANWCYQFSVITFCVNLISVPYNAAIVAHERMSAFAYISIFQAVGILGIALSVSHVTFDALIFYSFLVALLSVLIRIIYGIYCKYHFEECTYRLVLDKSLMREMFSFAGWNFIGSSSYIVRDQGGTILTNLFFGPSLNSARAIAIKVSATVTSFVQNFMVALNPQITKSYASGDRDYMMKLIFQGARLSYYILLLLSIPIILNTHYILVIWLKLVPEYAARFIQLILVFALSESLSNPLITAMLATGNIRNYQIVVGLVSFLNIPLSYVLLLYGGPPETVLVVAIVLGQCCLFARLLMLRPMIGLSIRRFMKDVYLNILIVSVAAFVVPFMANRLMPEGLLRFVLISALSVSMTMLSILYVGCSRSDRTYLYSQIQKRFQRKNA